MPREDYQETLDDLGADVVSMGERALEQLDDGLRALLEDDPELARAVIDADERLNERYLALESDCIDLLALQQPVAGDLRFVAASFKIITDLERVGDLATNLGRYALDGEQTYREEIDLRDVGTRAHAMVADSLDAYERRDPAACHEIARRDDELDAVCARANERIVRDLIEREAGDDAWELERLMDDVSRSLLTIRDLERVGDHGVNIAARTLYMIESDATLIY